MIVLVLCGALVLCMCPSYAYAQTRCEHQSLDIALVLDQTKSIGAENYQVMLEFVKSLISEYEVGEDKTHFAVVTFAKYAMVRVTLGDQNYHSYTALAELIEKMKHDKLKSPTRIDRAVKAANTKIFVPGAGDRSDSPNIMVLFADGNTNKASNSMADSLSSLEAKGVHRTAVAIGRAIKVEELVNITGDRSRVVKAKNFHDLKNKLDVIREVICNIDGGYTQWSEWSACSKSCGGGKRWRSRTCTNPKPKNKGKTCLDQNMGPATETAPCETRPCPIDGGYTEWSKWSACSKSCGGGVRQRARTCTNPEPKNNGKECVDQNMGPATETASCETRPCPIDGGYTEWSEWSACSKSCGGGERRRSRTCTNPKPKNNGKSCLEQNLGPENETKACEYPIDGGYTEWSKWSACSKSCGGGERCRYRTCTNPSPKNNGKKCDEQNLGPETDTEACGTQPCHGGSYGGYRYGGKSPASKYGYRVGKGKYRYGGKRPGSKYGYRVGKGKYRYGGKRPGSKYGKKGK